MLLKVKTHKTFRLKEYTPVCSDMPVLHPWPGPLISEEEPYVGSAYRQISSIQTMQSFWGGNSWLLVLLEFCMFFITRHRRQLDRIFSYTLLNNGFSKSFGSEMMVFSRVSQLSSSEVQRLPPKTFPQVWFSFPFCHSPRGHDLYFEIGPYNHKSSLFWILKWVSTENFSMGNMDPTIIPFASSS